MARAVNESARKARRDEEHLAAIAKRDHHDPKTCRCEGCALNAWLAAYDDVKED